MIVTPYEEMIYDEYPEISCCARTTTSDTMSFDSYFVSLPVRSAGINSLGCVGNLTGIERPGNNRSRFGVCRIDQEIKESGLQALAGQGLPTPIDLLRNRS